MSKPTGVSRRIEDCIKSLQSKDFEGSLVHLFPAIDATAKRRRPKDGVGRRVKAFIQDEEATISSVGTGSLIVKYSVDGVMLPEALYKFGRCPIAHEGELDPRLQFNDEGTILIGPEEWYLPTGYITGLVVATVMAPENAREELKGEYSITIFSKKYEINSIWGSRDIIEKHIGDVFEDHKIFSECRA